MTNLYETLGVTYESDADEIQKAFNRLKSIYVKDDGKEMDPMMKIHFDEILLAYKTLSNEESRAEYDDYISQNQRINSFRNAHAFDEDEDPEVVAERERRKRERGKKRFEEDYSFVNEEFFSSWQNRTNSHKKSFTAEGNEELEIETMFDG